MTTPRCREKVMVYYYSITNIRIRIRIRGSSCKDIRICIRIRGSRNFGIRYISRLNYNGQTWQRGMSINIILIHYTLGYQESNETKRKKKGSNENMEHGRDMCTQNIVIGRLVVVLNNYTYITIYTTCRRTRNCSSPQSTIIIVFSLIALYRPQKSNPRTQKKLQYLYVSNLPKHLYKERSKIRFAKWRMRKVKEKSKLGKRQSTA